MLNNILYGMDSSTILFSDFDLLDSGTAQGSIERAEQTNSYCIMKGVPIFGALKEVNLH